MAVVGDLCVLMLITFGLQIVVWRSFAVRAPYAAIALIWASVGIGYLFFAKFSDSQTDLMRILYTMVIYAALFKAVFLSYPGIESESPTNLILTGLLQYKDRGLSYEEIYQHIDSANLVQDRMESAESSGLIRKDHGRFFLTPKGKRFLRLFLWPRLITGRGKLEGA